MKSPDFRNKTGRPSLYAIGFNSRVKLAFLQIYLFLFRRSVHLFSTFPTDKGNIHPWFIRKGRVFFENRGIGEIKGLYYEVNQRAIDLTEGYFSQYVKNSYFIRYLDKVMKTQRFDYYLKKQLVYDFYEVLSGLHLVQEFSKDKRIVMINHPANRFVLNEFLKGKGVPFEVLWLDLRFFYWLIPFAYYLTLLKRLIENGVTYHKRLNIKLYKEAVWGLSRPTLRDDFLIDHQHFHKNDIIFYSRYEDEGRSRAVEQLKDRGYSVIELKRCKLNIKSGLQTLITIFLISPLWLCFVLIFNKKGYLVESATLFFGDSLYHFLFLTNYHPKCHISMSDHGEIAETIMMNQLGCENVIYHWSDMTAIKSASHAYHAHNIYYTWGPIHHDFEKEYHFYDKVEVVGCMFVKTYFDTLEKEKQINENKRNKRILICDDSFNNGIYQSEDSYLDGLDLVIDIGHDISDADFIFKPKNSREGILKSFTDERRRELYLRKIEMLSDNRRFTYYDHTAQIEPLIAISDVVVNIGLSSPALIALIVGKEAVYYDATGNDVHPLARYKGQVFFDDKSQLIEHVKEVLNHKKSVFDYIDPDLLNQYEPYRDSKALERLIQAIFKETDASLAMRS